MLFGARLGELIEKDGRPQVAIARALGLSQSTVSGYCTGQYLPAAEASVKAVARELAPTKKALPGVTRELLDRWRADLWDADLRAREMTIEQARAALDRLEEARSE